MRWRPRLVVRFGRGRSVSSPTSTAGYLFLGCIASGFLILLIAAAKSRHFASLPFTVVPLMSLRDVWAWFAASDDERRAFRAEVESFSDRGFIAPYERINDPCSPTGFVVLFVWLAGSLLFVARGYLPALISAGFALAVAVVALLDFIRARANRAHRP